MLSYLKEWWAWRKRRPRYPSHPEMTSHRYAQWRNAYDLWRLDRPRYRRG